MPLELVWSVVQGLFVSSRTCSSQSGQLSYWLQNGHFQYYHAAWRKSVKNKGYDKCSCEEDKIVSHKCHVVVEKSLRHDDVSFVDVEVKLLSSWVRVREKREVWRNRELTSQNGTSFWEEENIYMSASVNKITSKSCANSPQGICNPRTIMRWFVFPFFCVPKHLGQGVMKAMYVIN